MKAIWRKKAADSWPAVTMRSRSKGSGWCRQSSALIPSTTPKNARRSYSRRVADRSGRVARATSFQNALSDESPALWDQECSAVEFLRLVAGLRQQEGA